MNELAYARISAGVRASASPRRLAWLAGLALLTWALLTQVLPLLPTEKTSSGHWQSPGPVLLLGLISGTPYGLLAVGLVLVYRTNRIINFAHGQIGAFGSAFFGIEVIRWHLPYWIAFLPALAMAGVIGIAAEVAVVRRLRSAPPIMSVVATLGVGQFLVLMAFVINSKAGSGFLYPQPPGFPKFTVGALLVTPAYSGMLILCPLLVVAIGIFLKTSRFGLAIRATAGNPEAARLSGVFAARMSSLAWGLAGAVAAFSAILNQPTQGYSTGDSFGPSLLLIALTGAVIAKMRSLPIAMAAGMAIGVMEQLLLWNYAQQGLVEMVLFVIILVALLTQKTVVGRTDEKGSWAAVETLRPLPQAIRRVPTVRALGPTVAVLFFGAFALLPLFVTNSTATTVCGSFAFVIVGLSVGIATGLGGQLSLGQFAVAAVGAFVSFQMYGRTGSVVESFVYAGLASAAVCVLLALPALRAKGLLLAVTTLAFGLAMPQYLLSRSWLLGPSGSAPGHLSVFGKRLVTGHAYYYFGLAMVLVALLIARNVRTSGLGRRLVAVRDNEDAARSFTVSAGMTKVQSFAVAGFLSGLGGAMYGHSLSLLGPSAFPSSASITAVVIAVIGGLGLLSGPILGALVVQGATFIPLLGDKAGLAATSFGQLMILMYLPGGLGSLVAPVRSRVTGFLATRAGVDVAAAYAAERGFGENRANADAAPLLSATDHLPVPGGLLLTAKGLTKSFGGVRAVRGISFDVREGEILGLIGPNGAGKTTTFELLAGFTRLDAGRVTYAGTDVTVLGPEARGRLGLIRSFQDAALFPTLTVLECVELALERVQPTRFIPAVLGLRLGERKRRERAEELVVWMGLDRYRASQIRELSTGTRRITEIACLVALQPRMLLLDEPSSGVAQRETEALGALLLRLKEQLGLTLVVIEHDIPLIMGLSDRIVCMADGTVISQGSPAHVRHDPAVVEAYLGGSLVAIERSAGMDVPPVPARPDERATLDAVPGLGRARAEALIDTFGSPAAVLAAAREDLQAVPGIGPALADRIRDTTTTGSSS